MHSLELGRNFICGNETGSLGRAVSLHPARSSSQSEHRIRRIQPARGACHIISTILALLSIHCSEGIVVEMRLTPHFTRVLFRICVPLFVSLHFEHWNISLLSLLTLLSSFFLFIPLTVIIFATSLQFFSALICAHV